MRPFSSQQSLQDVQGRESHGEPRPKSGLVVRSKVLKSNGTAYNNWLRRSNEYNRCVKKHPQDYKSVETFNLRSGCRVTRSASQLRVKMDPDEFFDPKVPKISPNELPVKEMENMIRSLREQVEYLTVYLEEEKLHHAGTKKRAKMDIENIKITMERDREKEIEKLMQKNAELIEEMKIEHAKQLEELEEDLRKQYKKLEKEYRLLQASFKNYKKTISEDMNQKWNDKRREFDWEKQRSVENAVETTQKNMEEKFNKERISIRTEYKELMREMVEDQKKEMEEFMRKMSDGKSSVEALKARADQADKLEIELNKANDKIEAVQRDLKQLNVEFEETRSKLSEYENQFEEKVNEVEDKYQQRIDDLVTELSDSRLLLLKKAESLYSERAAADELQKKWTQLVKDKFRERILQSNSTNPNIAAARSANVESKISKYSPTDQSAVKDSIDVDDEPIEKLNIQSMGAVITEDDFNRNKSSASTTATKNASSSFELPPRKYSARKKERSCETDMDVEVVKAGIDKVRPRLPISTISLLDTADLPYVGEGEYRNQDHRYSRPHSPDVIF